MRDAGLFLFIRRYKLENYKKYLQIGVTENELISLEKKSNELHMKLINFIRYLIFNGNDEKNITKQIYEKMKNSPNEIAEDLAKFGYE
jgi:hypothetical protein